MERKDAKKISIIIPIYNTEKYLAECLESVLKQEFTDYEIIAINDGSIDGSLKILNAYADRYDNIKVISQENKGQSAARNVGLNHASGEYVCFLDSDDMLEEGALERMWAAVEEDNVDMLVFNVKITYEDEMLKKRNNGDAYYNRSKVNEGYYVGQDLFSEMIEKNEYIETVWLTMIRRSFIVENNIYFSEEVMYEDVLYCALCYMQAGKARYVKDVNYMYRIRQNSIMNSPVTYINIQNRLKCYDKMLGLLYTLDINNRAKWALKKYISTFVDEIMHDKCLVKIKDDFEKGLSARESLHLYAMGVESSGFDKSCEIYKIGFEELIKNSKGIYIYGAGKVGSKVYHYIKNMGLENKVHSFILTSSIESDNYMNVPIVAINDNQEMINQQGLIIVAVRKKYQGEIVRLLENKELRNYIVVDDKLEYVLDELDGC